MLISDLVQRYKADTLLLPHGCLLYTSVLVIHLEAVRQGQEAADRDRRHDERDDDLAQGLTVIRAVDLRRLHQVCRYRLDTCDVNDHQITDLLPVVQDDDTPVAVSRAEGQIRAGQFNQDTI